MRDSLFLLVLFTLLCSAQLKPCYEFWGLGRRLSSQIPCDPSANVSACCAPGGSCATNFYCNGAGVNDTFKRVGGCTDESGNDPACPLHLLQDPSVSNWWDSYDANTTKCGDGTFCMNPGNETCCYNREGVKEITYHNNATIPIVAEEWTTYYQDADYSVPTTTTSQLTSTLLASKDISTIPASTTAPAQSQRFTVSPSPASQTSSTGIPKPVPASTSKTTISPVEKAIIGVASALGVLGAVGSLYLFQRSRAKRRAQPESMQNRKAYLVEQSGIGYTAPSEMDAPWGWLSGEAHNGVVHEIMGQNQEGHTAELSG